MCADGKLEIAENGKKWDAENMAKRNLNGFGQLAMGLLGQGQHNQLLPPQNGAKPKCHRLKLFYGKNLITKFRIFVMRGLCRIVAMWELGKEVVK